MEELLTPFGRKFKVPKITNMSSSVAREFFDRNKSCVESIANLVLDQTEAGFESAVVSSGQ